MKLKLFIIFALVVLLLVTIVQNAGVVELRFLFWTLAMSRILMFIFLVLAGFVVGWLLRGHMAHRRSRETRGK